MRYLTNELDPAGVPTFADSDAELSPYSGPAARFWDFATDDMSQHGLDMLVRVVTTPHGTFRATVRQDEYPDAPDFEMGCPVYRVDNRRNYYGRTALDDKAEIGEDSARHDGMSTTLASAVETFAERHDDPLDVTDRWLRIFHGGSLTTLRSTTYQGGDDFVTYDTRAMRAYWGQTGEMLETSDPEAHDWQAYLDGEVYVVSVERAIGWDEDGEPDTWETLDDYPVGGYYGQGWAMQAAEDELQSTIEHEAGQMLPLGGE